MSFLSRRKKKFGYEGSTPACRNCNHYKDRRVVLTTNSQTKLTDRYCGLGGFTVTPNGCCNHWRGEDGTSLEKEKK